MELKDKKVIVAGSGKSGIASADLLKRLGQRLLSMMEMIN